MKQLIVKYVSKSEFETIKRTLSELEEFDTTEQYALTVKVKNSSIIVICNDPSLSKIEKSVILWHEKAHAAGIMDEEEADMWTLTHLSTEAKELLKQNWKARHGHEY